MHHMITRWQALLTATGLILCLQDKGKVEEQATLC